MEKYSCDERRFVIREAGHGITLIGTKHVPPREYLKSELERFKTAIEAQDALFLEGSSWVYRPVGYAKAPVVTTIEYEAFAHFNGPSRFLDDLDKTNHSVLVKKYGMRHYAFAALQALRIVLSSISEGNILGGEILTSSRDYFSQMRLCAPWALPPGDLDKSTLAALKTASNCVTTFGSLDPVDEINSEYLRFFLVVRDAEVYAPLMRSVVSATAGRKGVVIGDLHVGNLAHALEGREITVSQWPERVERMGPEARQALKQLIDYATER